jgi:2'-5' RNA ligase
MESIRAFIALPLPEKASHQLDQFLGNLKTKVPHGFRLVNIENTHLTLAFLGDTPLEKIKHLSVMLGELTEKYTALPVHFTHLGAFPSLARMRIFWLGMEATPKLIALQKDVNQCCRACNLPTDDKPFVPHLTLARLSDGMSQVERMQSGELLKLSAKGLQDAFILERLVLFQSLLKPAGAIYSPVHEFNLKNKKEITTEHT